MLRADWVTATDTSEHCSQDYQRIVIMPPLLKLQYSPYDSGLPRSASCKASRNGDGKTQCQKTAALLRAWHFPLFSLNFLEASRHRRIQEVHARIALGRSLLLFCAAARPIPADAGSLPQVEATHCSHMRSSWNLHFKTRLLTLPVLGLPLPRDSTNLMEKLCRPKMPGTPGKKLRLVLFGTLAAQCLAVSP